uniref:Protein cereblon n=1 Tax=Kalanchoe fedtschenkoi TaxID=63787 RepID=A0A7N0T4U8_KALFE
MEEEDRILARERHQMEQIRELDLVELPVEEVDDYQDSDGDEYMIDTSYRGGEAARTFTFDTCLASLHTYLGDVEDTQHRLSFLDGDATVTIPIFYLEGVVLFPEATLPLRVVQHNFIAAIERALSQVDTRYIIGVIRVYRDPDNHALKFANTGTTAEIRQYRRLEDGSLNVVTRGQQRFRVKQRWIDAEGTPCGEVRIIQEDLPLRTPRDALGDRTPMRKLHIHGLASPSTTSNTKLLEFEYQGNKSDDSFENELSLDELRMHQSVLDSCCGCDVIDESTSSDDDRFVCDSELQSGRSYGKTMHLATSQSDDSGTGKCPPVSNSRRDERWRKNLVSSHREQSRQVSRAFLPYWVYKMYDSYCLAERLTEMWKHIIGSPNMDGLLKKPDLLSFYIASQIPVSESIRQELLEIDGISYRLQREIELLEKFDRVRCKNCQTVIARRSDMLVMSKEGPLGAYVNPGGYVHEIMTLLKSNGLALIGPAVKEYSWFPGYALLQICLILLY